MRAITLAAVALLLCLVLTEGVVGTWKGGQGWGVGRKWGGGGGGGGGVWRGGGGGGGGVWRGVGGSYYGGYGNKKYYDYKPNYEHDSYKYYDQPNKAACTRYQICPRGYYFNREGCVCVSVGVPTASPTQPPSRPPATTFPPTPPRCTLAASSCFNRQQVNLDTCSCECIKYLLIVPGRPAAPGRSEEDTTGRSGSTRGTSKSTKTKGSRRSSRAVEEQFLELDDDEDLLSEDEGRFARSNSGSKSDSKSGTKSGTKSDGTGGSRSDSKSGSKSDSTSGSKSDGTSGTKSDGTSGTKSDGTSGSKSDGTSGSKSDSTSGTKSDSTSGSKSSSRGRTKSPGRPGVPARPPTTRLVAQCPSGTKANENTCICRRKGH